MSTQNVTANEHESIHVTHTSTSESDTQGTLHVWNDTKKGKFDFCAQIGIPTISGIVIVLLIAIGGWSINLFQANKAKTQRNIDKINTEIQGYLNRGAQASSTRQKVLTDYSNRISNLIFDKLSDRNFKNVLRGETLIALRRLDDKDEILQYAKRTQELEKELIKLTSLNTSKEKDPNEAENALIALDGFDDADELKGLLVRFLFESELLTRDEQIVDLSGANITRVNLNYAPLPDINLKGAWLTRGTFLNTDLRRANLSRTDLKEADLRGANLQGADLTDAKLQKADLRGINLPTTDGIVTIEQTNLQSAVIAGDKLNLSGACYDENTLIDWNLIDPIYKDSMRDTTGQPIDVSCKDLP